MTSEFGTIAVALLGGVAYGAGDFIGGRAALRMSVLAAVAVGQTVSLALLLQFNLASGIEMPVGHTAAMGVVAGLAYSAGLIFLYYGLAHARICVVAPLCGLFSVLIPLGGDILFEQLATSRDILGILCCIVAVALIAGSSIEGDAHPIAPSIRFGVISGIGFGVADLGLGLAPAETIMGSLLVTRSTAALVATTLFAILLLRPRAPHPTAAGTLSRFGESLATLSPQRATNYGYFCVGLIFACLAGICDTIGHVGYALSAAEGSMAVAAALVALFPAVSVTLAVFLLRERVTQNQLYGFAAGCIGIALVSIE